MRPYTRMFFLIVLLIALPCADAATPHDPETTTQFNQQYGKDLRQALRTRNDQVVVELAQRLVNEAPNHEDKKPLAVMQYEKAYELSAQRAGGVKVAVKAMEDLAAHDASRRDECTLKIVAAYRHAINLAKPFERYPTAWTFFSNSFEAADQAMAEKRFEQAQKIYNDIASTAKKISSDVSKLAGEGAGDARMGLNVQRAIKSLERRLTATPDDARVAKTLVESLVIDLNQLERAATFVDQANDPDWAQRITLLQKETEDLTADQAYDLGDWMMQSALRRIRFNTVQRSLYARAEPAFEHYLASHPSPSTERSKAERAIKKIRQTLDAFEDARQLAHEIPTIKGTVYFSCDWYSDVYLNETYLGRMFRNEIQSIQVTLKPGDIISAKLRNGAGTKGFWFRFESDDETTFFTSGRDHWYAYTPQTTATWWQVVPSKKHPRCRQEKYVDSVFVNMIRDRFGGAVKHQVIWGATRGQEAYIYFEVK